MANRSRASTRTVRVGIISMVVALVLWELGAMDYSREQGQAALWHTALGRVLIMLGGFAGGVVLALYPRALGESSGRGFMRWTIVMTCVLLPSAIVDFARAPAAETIVWAVTVSCGAALTACFVERRILSHRRE